jgi:PGF-CTERM protein
VTPGESVTVSTTVESTRIVASNAVVELRLDGDRLRTQRVSLAAGASATVEFTDVRLDGVAPGEYTLGVYTDEASRTATVTVIDGAADAAGETVERDGDATEGEDRLDETAPPSDTEPADDDVPEAEDDAGVTDDGTPGFGVVLVLTALVAFLVLARHRSRRNR